MSRTPTWIITSAPAPDSLDHEDAWAVHGASRVSFAVDQDNYGHDDVAYSARYLLTKLHQKDYSRRDLLVATPADATRPGQDDVVGWARTIAPHEGNEHLLWCELVVHPEHRRRGAGTALLEAAESLARELDRTTLIASSDHPGEPPVDDPDALTAPTGSGRIDGRSAGARFASRHGYGLEQAERYSMLHLPVPPDTLARLHDDAAAHAGPDYRIAAFADPAPEIWVDDLAMLYTRMSTEAPLGGLDMGEEPWDAGRVRVAEAEAVEANHGSLTVVAVHEPTGTLAAFTRIEWPEDEHEVVFQEDTLVLPEHRGRRLGMLVKSALLLELRERRPDAARVHTWNAEENEHMLGINVALGYRPAGVSGLWQKKL